MILNDDIYDEYRGKNFGKVCNLLRYNNPNEIIKIYK